MQRHPSIPRRSDEYGTNRLHDAMLWCPFNSSLNSSTRCELAAAIIAMLGPYPVNIGIDNVNVVLKGNEIIQHERRREKEEKDLHKRAENARRYKVKTTQANSVQAEMGIDERQRSVGEFC